MELFIFAKTHTEQEVDMNLRKRQKNNSEIFVGSMADVSFLLVIFFMVTTVLSTAKGIDFDLGEPPPPEDDGIVFEASIDVHVQDDSSLIVDGKPLAISSLLGYIWQRLEQDPKKPVIVRTEPRAPYGAMMAVLDELRQAPDKAGFEIVNLVIPTQREMRGAWWID